MSAQSEPLSAKTCTPCRGGIPPLTPEEVEGHHRQTPAWGIRDDSHRITGGAAGVGVGAAAGAGRAAGATVAGGSPVTRSRPHTSQNL